MTHVNTVRRGLGATAALVLLALSACGGDNDSSSAETQSPPRSNLPSEDQSNLPSGDPSLSGGGEATADTMNPSAPNAPIPDVAVQPFNPAGRKLVITMTVGVEVADAAAAVDKVIALADQHGGQLFNSSLDLTDPETAAGDLVFKLPPEQVQGFLSGLDPGIGRRTGMQGNTADVTKQLSDLDARILTATTSVDRVRFLLAAAENLDDVILLENELAQRETHLEQLRAQKADIDSQVAHATITVRLATAPVEEAAPEPTTTEDEDGISEAFAKGWKGFVDVVRGIAIFIGYTAPFLLIGAVVGLIWWRINRRRPQDPRRSRSTAPPPPPVPDAGRHTSTPDSADAARIP